ncbi:autotransporter assembly complex protein TamA [Kushneria aurantia]|uniref:Translocation and assembly module subunit TamA n=1 Tax=Kushneria aurantia TaxID=504092 RepID=A0ABV6G4C9_9GAMM|nr:autotransporter assembly complex family protein [Kushneria aurantia]
MTVAVLLGVSSALAAPVANAIEADVSGVTGELATNIRNYLEPLDIPADAELQGYSAEVHERVENALRPFGYYAPEIEIDLVSRDRVRLQVQHGPAVKLRSLTVELRGAASDDEPFQQAVADSPLQQMRDKRLRHAPYEALKSRLSALALERGYFDARYLRSRIEVRPWENAAYITLIFDSGTRYRFGDILVSGSQIRNNRVRNMAPFAPGDRYLATDVARYSQRLNNSGWFRSVGLRPRLDRQGYTSASRIASSPDARVVEPDGSSNESFIDRVELKAPEASDRVPIGVEVVPADRQQFEVGVGFATDVGPRTQFSWHIPWLSERGDSLENQLYLSGPEQTFSGEYSLPLENPWRDSYYLRYGLENTDQTDTDTRSQQSSISLGRQWRFENDWTQNVYLRASYEDFTQADQDGQVLLFVPGASWSRTRVDNQRFPMWGDRQDILVEGSSESWASDADFLRTRLDTQWIRSLGDNNRFIGRATLGATLTDDFSQIPPSLRFFTGGDRSVRGYDYETIAPRNDDGELLGGEQLLVTSLEYQRRVTGDWWGATFFDAGNAFNDWGPDELKKSFGAGVRWISPVGPIRLDIAHPLDDDDNAFRIHFGIGPEF